ncbi:Nutrient Amino Acid Transporter 1 [Carabus blaptoides fortunei]
MSVVSKSEQCNYFFLKRKTDNDMKGEVNVAYVPDTGDLEKTGTGPVFIKNGKTDIISVEEPDSEKRAQWGNGMEFLMSCIAMSVGLGNIWRFPYTAYQNGGGAFLIPYIITLVIIGRPLYYMEMVLGQFTSKGNVHTFASLAPGLGGIGYGQMVSVIGVATYYCSLMALTLYYFFSSFSSVLPWSMCEPEWTNCVNASGSAVKANDSLSSSEYFFSQTVLHEKSQIDDGIGAPDWKLTLYLFASWVCVFLVAVKGVKSSGKVSYFLALFPYVVLIAILIRAVTLPGSVEGILFFIEPKWGELLNPNVWYAAVSQCFFSLNVGFGSIIMYASYNDFKHGINRDALIVSGMDTFTSLLAGFTIFAILGNLAHELNTDIDSVVKTGGTGLAFISYPDAIAKFDTVPQLFAVLFFFMLFVLGVGSLVALQSCVATVLKDGFPFLKNWQVAAGTCIIGFLIGLVYVTPGGQFILTIVDHFAGTFNLYMMTVAEIIAVMWWYGLEDICLDMEFMLDMKVNAYWRICWAFVTPVLLIIILIYSLITMKELTYGSAAMSTTALGFGWFLLVFGVCQIPAWMLWYMHKKRKLGGSEMLNATFSRDHWGPKDPERNKEWREFKKQAWEQRKNRGESRFKWGIHSRYGSGSERKNSMTANRDRKESSSRVMRVCSRVVRETQHNCRVSVCPDSIPASYCTHIYAPIGSPAN